MSKYLKIIGLHMFLAVCMLLPMSAGAAFIEMQEGVSETGGFPLGPTAFTLELEPGQTVTKQLQVSNRTGHIQNFHVEVEDFQGSATDPSESLKLQGEMPGKNTARSWVRPELSDFTLQHGERQYFDVVISVPQNVEPGDHYTSVLVSAPPQVDIEDNNRANVMINQRVGSLFFITVKGDINKAGGVESFTSDKTSYSYGPVKFNAVFRNEGNVRLKPYGQVQIYNSFGSMIDNVTIKPFGVLRESVGQTQIDWQSRGFMMGKYTAKLLMYNGYDEEPEIKTLTFLVIPWVFLSKLVITLIVLVVLLKMLGHKIEIKFKKTNK